MIEVLALIFETHRATFLQPFQFKLFPRLMTYFNQTEKLDQTSFAVAIIGSVICDGRVFDFFPQVFETLLRYTASSDPDLANNAIYYIGAFSKLGMPQYQAVLPTIVSSMGKMLNRSRTRSSLKIADQVILCFGTILANYAPVLPNAQQILAQVLQMFPANSTFESLIEMLVELHQKNLLIPGLQLFPDQADAVYRLVVFLAAAVEKDAPLPAVKNNIVLLVTALNTYAGQQTTAAVWQRLTTEQKGDLDALFRK